MNARRSVRRLLGLVRLSRSAHTFSLHVLFRYVSESREAKGFIIKWQRLPHGLMFSERYGGYKRQWMIGRLYARGFARKPCGDKELFA